MWKEWGSQEVEHDLLRYGDLVDKDGEKILVKKYIYQNYLSIYLISIILNIFMWKELWPAQKKWICICLREITWLYGFTFFRFGCSKKKKVNLVYQLSGFVLAQDKLYFIRNPF